MDGLHPPDYRQATEVKAWLDNPNDATADGVARLRAASNYFRSHPWPHPYSSTQHDLHLADSRQLDFVETESIDLVVTSPPYWTLKEYDSSNAQIGAVQDYEEFLAELCSVLAEVARILKRGGRACVVVGDICLSRKAAGRHFVMPLHADIQVMSRAIGLDCLTPIIWQKIANGRNEVSRSGSGFYGKPYQPGAIIKNDIEYILFLRKPGGYRNPSPLQKTLSLLDGDQMKNWMRTFWSDIRGASTRNGHPAPFPVELAERLIRMFSFAGDTILDPFAGSGTTGVSAIRCGRNSIQVEISRKYFDMMSDRTEREIAGALHDAKLRVFP